MGALRALGITSIRCAARHEAGSPAPYERIRIFAPVIGVIRIWRPYGASPVGYVACHIQQPVRVGAFGVTANRRGITLAAFLT